MEKGDLIFVLLDLKTIRNHLEKLKEEILRDNRLSTSFFTSNFTTSTSSSQITLHLLLPL